jgi:beta-xylosidase
MSGWALFLLAVVGGGLLGLAFRTTRRVSLVLAGFLLVTVGGIGLRGIGVARATTCSLRLPPSCAPTPRRVPATPVRPARLIPPPPPSVPILPAGTSPVYANDFPDPFVLPVGDGYYGYATNRSAANVPVIYSKDLVHWTSLGDALPQLPSWAVQGRLTWAPSVIAIEGEYRMYVAVGDKAHHSHCIGVASSANPAGPFSLDATGPLVCGRSDAIDPSPFRAADGTLWLAWKYEPGASGSPRIVSQQLAPDGRTLIGSPTTLLTPGLSWEHGNVEGPSVLYRNGEYLLFYSAGDWQTAGYATGVAHCVSPSGPCVKEPQPLLSTSSARVGPGGASVFATDTGDPYLAFHTWHGGLGYAAGGVRALNIRALVPDPSSPRALRVAP